MIKEEHWADLIKELLNFELKIEDNQKWFEFDKESWIKIDRILEDKIYY